MEALLSVIRQRYMPDLVLVYAENTSISELARHLVTKENGRVAAYVCKNNTLYLPVRNPDELIALLDRIAPKISLVFWWYIKCIKNVYVDLIKLSNLYSILIKSNYNLLQTFNNRYKYIYVII